MDDLKTRSDDAIEYFGIHCHLSAGQILDMIEYIKELEEGGAHEDTNTED